MRNILNQQKTNFFVNTVSAREPLDLLTPSNTSSTMTLKGLNGFGTAGQIIKVNSGADGLEYGDESTASNWVADGTDLRVLNQTAYNYVELKRTDTGDVGFKLNNTDYESKFYINGDNTIIATANGKIKLEDTNISINNSSDNNIVGYTFGSVNLGNTTDFTTIYGIRTLLNENERSIATYSSSTTTLSLGNTIDTLNVYKPLITGDTNDSNRFTIKDYNNSNLYYFQVSNITTDINVILPALASNDYFVFDSNTATLSNKTLNLPKISDTSGHTYNIKVNDLAANRDITLPLLTGNDEFVFKDHTQTLTNKTITGTFTGNLSGNATTATDLASISASDIVVKTGSQTLQSKLFLNCFYTNVKINDTSSNHNYILLVNELTADRNITLPLLTGNDEFTFNNHTQTLTNKTLTSPVLNTSISGSAFLDEDNMASNSATKVCSQQSIKAYVDNHTGLWEVGGGATIRPKSYTAYNYIEIERTDNGNVGVAFTNLSYNAYVYINSDDLVLEAPNGKTKLYGTAHKIVNNSNNEMIGYASSINNFGNTTEATTIKGNGITLVNNTTLSANLSATSTTLNCISLLNGALNNNWSGRPLVLQLNTAGQGDNYGLGHLNSTYSTDIYTFCNQSGTQASFIGSQTAACYFGLFAGDKTFLMSNPSNRQYCVLGKKVQYDDDFTAVSPLHICNHAADIGTTDASLTIESRKSTYDPFLTFRCNTGDESTTLNHYISAKSNGQMIIQGQQEILFHNNGSYTAEFDSNQDLFCTADVDIYGSNANNNNNTSTNPIGDIYVSDTYCENIFGLTGLFDEDYDTIEPFSTTGASNTRLCNLMIGRLQTISSFDNQIYPVIRINPPRHTGGPWFFAVQDNSSAAYINFSYGTSNVYSLRSDKAAFFFGSMTITSALSKGSGSFKIPHPLDEENKTLYHSFVESPRCDNIYSGKIQLVNGKANVNMDNNDYYSMTEGTFLALNKDFRIYVNNNEDFDRVIGKLKGNVLEIICENTNSNVIIDWMVIATRQDSTIKESPLTDSEGNLITETNEKTEKYKKPPPVDNETPLEEKPRYKAETKPKKTQKKNPPIPINQNQN